MDNITASLEIDGETWTVTVHFGAWSRGPQYDEAPAMVARDGEAIPNVKWANTFGGEPQDWALVDNGCLWTPGVVGNPSRANTARAFERLTLEIQRVVWAKRGPGRATGRRAA